jgi:cell division protein FtsN
MQHHSQRGGTFLGFVIGLVLGLGVALAVAVYVTKVPTPFSNKNQPRTNDQDVQETVKNKDWNPNSVFQPKPPAEVPTPPPAATAPVSDLDTDKPTSGPVGPAGTAGKAATDAPKTEARPAVTADPLGDLAKAKSGLSTPAASGNAADPFDYVIQVGAYRTLADADAQKAKLTLMGLDAKVSERDQAGRTVYRVRLGPFTDKTTAERIRTRLEGSGLDNTLVRVQR